MRQAQVAAHDLIAVSAPLFGKHAPSTHALVVLVAL